MHKGMLQVLLNNHGMQQINEHKVSNTLIASHLSVTRKAVSKHRENMIPLRKPHKESIHISANQLCQTMIKFWLDHRVPSLNQKDVKWKHSDKPGDHVHVQAYNEDMSAYTILHN